MRLKLDPQIIISTSNYQQYDVRIIRTIKRKLQQFGYNIISHNEDLDKDTISAILSFTIQYVLKPSNTALMLAYYALCQNIEDVDARTLLTDWTENHDMILDDLLNM
jgi:N-acetyl-anhydromuramyl-L-alanine amidase AmpD